MKGLPKELLTVTAGLVALYLIVVHYTGFSRVVGAGSNAYTSGVKVLQGR
jgi:hypothetical protein